MSDQREHEVVICDVQALGEQIRRVRRAQQVTQEELADYAGLSRVSVMKVEKGGDVRLSNLLRLTELLGLELVVRPRGLK